ncbi:MAG: phosphate/phosphite/phosphonate ABC transporter substrate-binding protein [Candidatus Thiodiazotropha sp.]
MAGFSDHALRRRVPVLLLVLLTAFPLLAEPPPIRLGIMPFNSTLALIRTHQPLRKHLQQALGQPVEIYTSADYDAFQRDSLAGEFDILVTGPHFAVMCIDQGYVPLVRYDTALQPVFVLNSGSEIQRVEDFRNRRIGLPNRLSVSAIGGLRWLREKGLVADRDFFVLEKTTHGAAIAGVAVGDLDAALTTYTPLKQVPEDIRAHIRVLPTEVEVPHLMTLAHERLGSERVERIRAALTSFPATPDGDGFFRQTGYRGYLPVDDASITALQPYVPIVRELMGLQEGRP